MDEVRGRFAVEIRTFESHLAQWLADSKAEWWVAIQGDRVVGPMLEYRDLWRNGVDRLGPPGSFLVKKVEAESSPIVISHFRWRRPPSQVLCSRAGCFNN